MDITAPPGTRPVEELTYEEAHEELQLHLAKYHHVAYLALAKQAGMTIPKCVPKAKDLNMDDDRFYALLKKCVGYPNLTPEEEEQAALERYKFRNTPFWISPSSPTPKERELEQLYRKGKLVIEGKLVRWDLPCPFSMPEEVKNYPSTKKLLRQVEMFP